MAVSNDINELNKQIQEIAKELNKTNFKLFKPGEVAEAQVALKGLREELREFNNELSYIAGGFREALNELSKQSVALTDSNSDNFQYCGQTGSFLDPWSKIAGNSTKSHWSPLTSF